MNEKNYFTIVVPLSPDAQKIVQGNPSAVPLRAAVWSQAAERMKPLLGGVCSRFSPAVAPYGEPLHLPFGVALGGAEAEQFLLCYFHARENQEEEIRSRTQAIRALGRKVGQFHPDEEIYNTRRTLCQPTVYAAGVELRQSFPHTGRFMWTRNTNRQAGTLSVRPAIKRQPKI